MYYLSFALLWKRFHVASLLKCYQIKVCLIISVRKTNTCILILTSYLFKITWQHRFSKTMRKKRLILLVTKALLTISRQLITLPSLITSLVQLTNYSEFSCIIMCRSQIRRTTRLIQLSLLPTWFSVVGYEKKPTSPSRESTDC